MGRREMRAQARSPGSRAAVLAIAAAPPQAQVPASASPDRVALTRTEHDELQALLQMHQQALQGALQAAAQRYAAAHGIDVSAGAAEKWTLLYDTGVFVRNA